MNDPHDDTDVPSGTTDGAQMERTLPPVRLEKPMHTRQHLHAATDAPHGAMPPRQCAADKGQGNRRYLAAVFPALRKKSNGSVAAAELLATIGSARN